MVIMMLVICQLAHTLLVSTMDEVGMTHSLKQFIISLNITMMSRLLKMPLKLMLQMTKQSVGLMPF